MRPLFAKLYPFKHNADVSKLLGEQWRLLDMAEKQEFQDAAAAEKIAHQLAYPDYKYTPRFVMKKSKKIKVGPYQLAFDRPITGLSNTMHYGSQMQAQLDPCEYYMHDDMQSPIPVIDTSYSHYSLNTCNTLDYQENGFHDLDEEESELQMDESL